MCVIHLLIIFSSVSDLSGLHDNILETALEAKSRNHDVTVVYREGAFLDNLRDHKINVIADNCLLRDQAVQNIIKRTNNHIDIIHCHPGDGRKVALKLSRTYKIPLIMTLHGKWTDSTRNYIDDLDAIFTVSNGIKDKLITELEHSYHKCFVIPNYSSLPSRDVNINAQITNISIVSRFDKDKELVIQTTISIIRSLINNKRECTLNIIGTGTGIELIKNYISEQDPSPNLHINFLGWISDKLILSDFFIKSDLIIGPGRVAIDAMTLGIPVLVVGSKNYLGFLNNKNWSSFVYTNFGGYGLISENCDYSVENDLNDIFDYNLRRRSVSIGKSIVDNFFSKSKINDLMFSIYDNILKRNEN